MYALRRKILINAFKLFDQLNMGVSLILSIIVVSDRFTTPSLSAIGQVEIKILSLLFFILALFTWHLIFSSFKLYHSRRLSGQSQEIVDVLKATLIGAAVLLIEAIFFRMDAISFKVIAVFWIFAILITISSRIVLRHLLRWVRIRGRNLRHVLIIGTNSRAVQFGKKLLASPELGYNLIGFVDDDWVGIDSLKKTSYRLVCDLDGFQAFVRNLVVDEVIVALPLKSLYDQASRIIAICEEQGITARYLSNLFDVDYSISRVRDFEKYSLIPLPDKTIQGYESLIKQFMDLLLSSFFLLLLSPIFILTAIAIKLTSEGPVFFIQKRVGLGKRVFNLFKFRTMVMDAERKQEELEDYNEACGPVFKIADDPRITTIGRFLRKTSIDELPQFINVIKGDMSIVGPRPLPVRDYNGFNEDWHLRRFSVRPGITCLWQVRGRCSIPFEKWMELDMEYIDRWSLWLDLKIVIKTIPVVLKGIGAV